MNGRSNAEKMADRQAGRRAGGKVGRKADWAVGRQENNPTKFDIWSFKKVNTD
jgi:hypothetical protein